MKMELGIGLRQSVSIEQSIAQRLEVRQQINLKNFDAIERGVVGDPNDLLEGVIAYTVSQMPNESVRHGVAEVLAEPSLRAALLYNVTEVAFDPRQHTIERFVARWFHDTHGAAIMVEANINHAKVELHIPLEAYTNALFDPTALERELTQLRGFVADTRRKPDEGTLLRIAELQGARDIVPTIRSYIDPVATGVQYALMTKVGDHYPLLNFLRDYAVIKNTRFVLSTRMVDRFSARFMRIGKRSTPQEFENAFLNCIGEYVLVGLGVIEPDLFKLYRADIVERMHSGGAPTGVSERAVADAQNPKKKVFF